MALRLCHWKFYQTVVQSYVLTGLTVLPRLYNDIGQLFKQTHIISLTQWQYPPRNLTQIEQSSYRSIKNFHDCSVTNLHHREATLTVALTMTDLKNSSSVSSLWHSQICPGSCNSFDSTHSHTMTALPYLWLVNSSRYHLYQKVPLYSFDIVNQGHDSHSNVLTLYLTTTSFWRLQLNTI